MKKILFVMLCCLCLCGCSKGKEEENNNSNEYICNKIDYSHSYDTYKKETILIEHKDNTITNIISINIERNDTIDKLTNSKRNFEEYVCDLGDYDYCNAYILKNSMVLITEYSFLPKEDILNLNDYISYVEGNKYTCIQY